MKIATENFDSNEIPCNCYRLKEHLSYLIKVMKWKKTCIILQS